VFSLLRYAGSIIVRPFSTWRAIAAEPISNARLAFGYVLPLALIGPVATFLARRFVGARDGYVVYRESTNGALGQAAFSLVLALIGLILVALLVDILAPLFGAGRSFGKALRVTAFAYTPVWIAAITVLVPRIGNLQVGGLQLLALAYEIVLLHAGLAAVMGVSPKKAGALAVCAVAGTVLIAVAFGELFAAVAHDGGG
jgi:hypothetical protein